MRFKKSCLLAIVSILIIFIAACASIDGSGTEGSGGNTTTTAQGSSTTSSTIDPGTTTSSSTTTTSSTTSSTTTTIFPIYVSTAGNDSNSGSPAAPLKTISKALTMIDSSHDNIYLSSGAYNELVAITASVPVTIKGGFNGSWERDNTSDKSTIGGVLNATTSTTGRITVAAGSKLMLENLYIKGSIYNSYAYGIYNSGDLTIDNCDISALDGMAASSAYGVYNNGSASTLSFLSGTIVGASGTVTVVDAYGIKNYGTLLVVDGSITGCSNNITITTAAYGIDSVKTATIRGGVITGAKNSNSIKKSQGIYISAFSTLSIFGGTIVGGDNITITTDGYGILGSGTDNTVSIFGGAIVGVNNSTASSVYGFSNSSNAALMTGGTIVGANNSTATAYCYGIDNGAIIDIFGGTIGGAAGSSSITTRVCGVQGGTGTTSTISNCEIYGKETATSGTALALRRSAGTTSSKFYKDTSKGGATIQDERGTGANLWESFSWN